MLSLLRTVMPADNGADQVISIHFGKHVFSDPDVTTADSQPPVAGSVVAAPASAAIRCDRS